jgi:NAD+ kinase
MRLHFIASRSEKSQAALADLTKRHGQAKIETAEVIIALGGDGLMLEVLHQTAHLDVPVYGMNRGTVGFLMNSYEADELEYRVSSAIKQVIHPLSLTATDAGGNIHHAHAINEVSLLRKGPQAANLKIRVDGLERMPTLMGDGVLLATPAGSTAYNYSAFGPILPIGANVLALTPIAAFRPRRWRGAVLPAAARVGFENIDPSKRPLVVSADGQSFEDIVRAEVFVDTDRQHNILFDPNHGLEERILREQFE